MNSRSANVRPERASASRHGLSPRAAGILRAVVSGFLRTGEPVGSSAVLRETGFPISSATIRVELGRLTDDGLLEQPHTSAGRVPTLAGFRLYIDHLMRVRPPSADDRGGLDAALRDAGEEPGALVRAASRHLAVVCMATALGRRPRLDVAEVRRLELVPLDDGRVLAVLLFADGGVRDRVLRPTRAFAAEELRRAMNLFNGNWTGIPLALARARLAAQIAERAESEPEVPLLRLAERALPPGEAPEDAIIIEGRTHLLSSAGDPEQATGVLRALEDERALLALLDDLEPSGGPEVLIGAETSIDAFRTCTVVRAAYGVVDRRLGTIAVVGPLRMNYSRVVSWVGYTAERLSGILHASHAA